MQITFKDILKALDEKISDQRAKMAATQSNLEAEKLDRLTMAKFQIEEYVRLETAH